MGYRSDITIVVKHDDYMKLWETFKMMNGIPCPSIGTFENDLYALFSFLDERWDGEWTDEGREFKHRFRQTYRIDAYAYEEEQEKFMDELKKFDFYNFIRIGEEYEDHEEYYSNDDKKLIRFETLDEFGDRFVVIDPDVFYHGRQTVEINGNTVFDVDNRRPPIYSESEIFDPDNPTDGKYFPPVYSLIRKKDGSVWYVSKVDLSTGKVTLEPYFNMNFYIH